jgi:hypothetical protein
MMDELDEDLFLEDDPFWEQEAEVADAPPRPAKGYMTCSLAWLARVRPLLRSVEQLLVLQLIYRRCLLARSRTVSLPNSELKVLGIHPRTKARALTYFNEIGIVSVEALNGRAPHVTLLDFP